LLEDGFIALHKLSCTDDFEILFDSKWVCLLGFYLATLREITAMSQCFSLVVGVGGFLAFFFDDDFCLHDVFFNKCADGDLWHKIFLLGRGVEGRGVT